MANSHVIRLSIRISDSRTRIWRRRERINFFAHFYSSRFSFHEPDGVRKSIHCQTSFSSQQNLLSLRLLMLALRRLRCLVHSTPVTQTRTLRTRPRPLPTYTRQWNPTLHTPIRTPNPSNDPAGHDDTSRAAIEQTPVGDAKDDLRPAPDQHNNDEDLVIDVTISSFQIACVVKRLQYFLNRADLKDDVDAALRGPLWNAYTEATKWKISLLKGLPYRAWNILWRSQYADFSNVSRRQINLARLNQDLITARAHAVAGQVAYRIERRFMTGMQEEALRLWTSSRSNFPTAPEYLDTGARLYALAGYPDQARNIMDRLLELYPSWDVSVMVAVFRAYTSSRSKDDIEKAQEIYHIIKQRVAPVAALEVYDSCLIGFLEVQSLPDAKQVFRDMVCGGLLETEGSQLQAERVLKRLNLLYALGRDISGMSSIALDAIAVLPVAYHGHVFSDWMKSAMVGNAPQAAAQILDVMIQRGYRPETQDFDYLLRSLIRTKEAHNLLKAENIGWKMIEQARMSAIPTDRHPSGSRLKAIAEKLQTEGVLDADPAASVPPASTSTFALIMRHHASKSQWEHVDYLSRQLKLANIKMNSTIMNVVIENEGRKGQFNEAWQIYKSLTDNTDEAESVFPDGETFAILWRNLRFALGNPANLEDPNLPTPRKLLRETVDWWLLVRQRPDADRFLRGLAADDRGGIEKLMLHCFSCAQDLSGSLVALHVLRQKFDIYPTKNTVKTVLRQLSWEAKHDETQSMRRHFRISKDHSRNMRRLTHIYEAVSSYRLQRLKITADMLRNYSSEQLGDLELNTISEFVRAALLAHPHHSPEIVELLIEGAANAAGVAGITTGDVTVVDMLDDW